MLRVKDPVYFRVEVVGEKKLWVYFESRVPLLLFYDQSIYFFFFLLYNIVLVLPYINMNLPWVYTCPPSWTLSHLPPNTIRLGHPSAPALSILYHALNLDWQFISHMILYMFQCHSPKSSHPRPLPPTESKRLFYTSVSLLMSCIQGYRYHLYHILYWCFSFWLTSLCIRSSSFIHLIRTELNAFLN